MGLDMVPLAAPKPGHEAEFNDILQKLKDAETVSFAGFLSSLFGKKPPVDRGAIEARFHEISIPHYANLNAPIVGEDQDAEDWIVTLWESGDLAGEFSSAEAAVQDFR